MPTERVKLVVSERAETGSRAAKRLRAKGLVPGVLYSGGRPAVAFSVPVHDLREAMSTEAGRHAILDVVFEGRKRAHAAVVQDVQLDAVKHTVTHVDLHEVHLNEPIETKVAVQLEGTSPGVKAGGMLEMFTHEVTVRGLPADIPEHLTMNIDEVGVGQVVRIKELPVSEGLVVLDDPEETLFHIVMPRVAAEGAAPVEAAPKAEEVAEEAQGEEQVAEE
jgi:large subunit ribosomal protein L25